MTGLEKLVSMVTNRSGKSRRRKQSSSNRFVVYYRVSTRQQGQSGLGLEAQKAAAEAYVKQRGGEIIGEYQEVETGKDCERPEILRAIFHANRSWATLVIAKLDRLARSVWFCSTLLESGIDFICCDCPQASKLTIHVMASIAEHEAELISCRTRRRPRRLQKTRWFVGASHVQGSGSVATTASGISPTCHRPQLPSCSSSLCGGAPHNPGVSRARTFVSRNRGRT